MQPIAVLLVALAASGTDRAPEAGGPARATRAPPPRAVTVVARDHASQAPDTIAGGAVAFRLRDLGPTSHRLIAFRPADSVSLREFHDGTSPRVVAPPADGRPHVERGVRTVFRVEEAPHVQPARAPAAAPAALPGHVVDVAAGELFFRSPDSIPAGLTTFRLSQVGLIRRRALAGGAARDSAALDRGDQTRGFHMLWIVRLDDGKTASDYHRAVAAGEPTPWARVLGGPGFSMPPGTSNATLVLEPGRYVLACFVGSARADRSRYHFLHGMFRPLTVLPSASPRAELPVPDVVVRISESGAIHFSAPILPGQRLLRVENASARAYEFSVRRVLPGRSTEEALAWRRPTSPTARAPFEPRGGLSDVPAGGSLLTTMSFEPGDYFVGGAERVPFTVGPPRR